MDFKVYIFIYLYLVFIYIHILHIGFYLYIGIYIYKNIFLLYYIVLSIDYITRAYAHEALWYGAYSWESRRLRDEENHHTPPPPRLKEILLFR